MDIDIKLCFTNVDTDVHTSLIFIAIVLQTLPC